MTGNALAFSIKPYPQGGMQMKPTLCSRCGKNVAVIFITKLENGQAKNEGLCLKCARELHIKPVDDIINKMGISDDDLEGLAGDMTNALNGAEELLNMENSGDDVFKYLLLGKLCSKTRRASCASVGCCIFS